MGNYPLAPATPIRLGVSACLLGEKVRYNGEHKRSDYVTQTLRAHFELISVCPEVAVGLGVPRVPIELIGNVRAPRAVNLEDRTDVTAKLANYGQRMARELDGISGYVFKSRSPSCGLKVSVQSRGSTKHALGIYAAQIMRAHTSLPMEDEERLADMAVRDNFLERVFAYYRWQRFLGARVTVGRLMEFHAAHKLTLMAHGASAYSALGRLLATASGIPARALAQKYGAAFMRVLARPTTRGHHANALQHASGFLKQHLTANARNELQGCIECYRATEQPLIAPLRYLQRHFEAYPHPWIAQQVYLYPDALELKLRYC